MSAPEEPAEVEPVPGPDPAPDPGPGEEGRRYPSTIGGALYLAVLAVVGVAIVVVVLDDWRTGIRWYGGALVAAAVLRALLPAKDAGMLAVRKRWWDCLLLAGTGAALLLLAGSIPDQPL